MSSDADLSTDDLARRGGVRDQDTAAAGERGFEHRGNVAGGGQEDMQPGLQEGAQPGVQEGMGTGPRGGPAGGGPLTGGADGDAGPAGGQRAGTMSDTTMPDTMADGSAGATQMQDTGGRQPAEGGDVALLEPADGERFRQRWNDAQAHFVDDPQEAVQTADALVAELMQSLARSFAEHKGRLESAWQGGGDPDTEDLRRALQRYRSFFDRLLST